MSAKTVHIVSFTVPFPANYGGVIDVFYKIKSLHQEGINIILHCFASHRNQAPELEKYCSKVYYYSRSNNPLLLLSTQPFIVSTRKSTELIENLSKDNFPILLEGLHCCSLLTEKKWGNRKIIVRSHNIEHDYYQHLAAVEKSFLKRWYFNIEARKLKRFEKKVFPLATEILGISEKDTLYLQKHYQKGTWVSAFHPFEKINISNSSEPFAYYHGNLEIGENNQAAIFLVGEVFSKCSYPLIIAGNSPSNELKELCKKYPNVELKANVSPEKIMDYLQKAQINILPTFQSTGIKLKLLAALFGGKHCLVNTPMVLGTGLESLCHIANSPTEFIQQIQILQNLEFSPDETEKRSAQLQPFFNSVNAQKIATIV